MNHLPLPCNDLRTARCVAFWRLALLVGTGIAILCAVLSGTRVLAADMAVQEDVDAGSWMIRDGERPVLVYRYKTQEAPAGFLAEVHPDNLKYARARSNYIHPLYGLDGGVLTRDWPVDHPHHRGIYWAWPEVGYLEQPGDLHALERVFARPTGECSKGGDGDNAWIEAWSQWFWEDQVPVVRELARIQAWKEVQNGRAIDLTFTFEAIVDGVTLARRETTLYGGLNLRFAEIAQQEITRYTASGGRPVRDSWADITGVFPDIGDVAGVTILQHPDNPDYPGDWVEYPDLNWLQLTFPQAGRRYPLVRGQPLVLRYRLWVHRGRCSEESLRKAWSDYLESVPSSARR